MKKLILAIFIIGVFMATANAKDIKITVADKEFIATLEDSKTTEELIALLPLDVTMNEHAGVEKYYRLPKSLSGESKRYNYIEEGDFMLYSSRTLVLFYESHNAYYSYIRLGKIRDISGFKEALDSGSVKVKFELE